MAKELITRLQGFTPSAGSLERDQMVFNAGMAAGRAGSCHQSWRWLTLGLCLSQGLLIGIVWFRDTDRPSPDSRLQMPPVSAPSPLDEAPRSPFRPNTLSAMPRDLDQLPDYVPEQAGVASDEPSLTAGKIPDHLMLSQ
jgi:hypothetical protein